jgi:hypothetical protein
MLPCGAFTYVFTDAFTDALWHAALLAQPVFGDNRRHAPTRRDNVLLWFRKAHIAMAED